MEKTVLPFLGPLEASKLYKNIFYLLEEVLSFDLGGHMWKSIKNFSSCDENIEIQEKMMILSLPM